MSTLIYGALTRKRKESPTERSALDAPPGLRKYVDALAALVPAEVLALHAAALSLTTTTINNASGEAVTTIIDPTTLSWAFWGCLVFCIVLYFVGLQSKPSMGWDIVRMFIPPLAFVGWTMAQKATAFDAVAPTVGPIPRGVAALFLAVILGAIAGALADKADKQPPTT